MKRVASRRWLNRGLVLHAVLAACVALGAAAGWQAPETVAVHAALVDGGLQEGWQVIAGDRTRPGEFDRPHGVAVDAQGNIYVADTENHRIQKLSAAGEPLARWGSFGSAPGQFDGPYGVAVDAEGNIYVADTRNERIQKLSPAGEPVAQWGTPQRPSRGGTPGLLAFRVGVAVDDAGNIYVAHFGRIERFGGIERLSPVGEHLAQWGTRGDGPGEFNAPAGVAVDGPGDIFVADTRNNRIQKLSAVGEPVAQWGTGGSAPGQFARPGGVALDAEGNIYVADTFNNRIQKLPASVQQ